MCADREERREPGLTEDTCTFALCKRQQGIVGRRNSSKSKGVEGTAEVFRTAVQLIFR